MPRVFILLKMKDVSANMPGSALHQGLLDLAAGPCYNLGLFGV